ncbi:MAG: hypothetical protein P0Y65_05610 [Candidatus Devosia phytovorans]|uniref:Uncharacterized protein n=1 Tax=Candidatus Devosia phytovorans TaxID=3121372 RepID=A0AAJ5VX77_9HYPH|nr:hypothetical protein [Devosia sp.]WEK05731.1 MAG: hypothetical protein P0Y65_05610 [Devosia sp.]
MNLVSLDDCPPGLFWFDGSLCFKSEYSQLRGTPDNRLMQCDAYVVASGEYFWGGTSDVAARSELMVQPIHFETATAAIAGEEL